MCLISDQGCGSAVRVVLRELLAQSEMRGDHNYYGSLFFWECQPSFADPRGLNNLKSGLAEPLFLSLLPVPSQTWGFSLLFSKTSVTFNLRDSPEQKDGEGACLGLLVGMKGFKIVPTSSAWLHKTDRLCWSGFHMEQGCGIWECRIPRGRGDARPTI